VSHIDIAPTLLEAAGIPAPESFSGLSLLGELPGDRYVLIQHPVYLPGTAPGPRRMHRVIRSVAGDAMRWSVPGKERVGLVGGSWKYLRSSEGEELYPMAPEPREGVNLADRERVERVRLGALLDAELERHPLRLAEPGVIDEALLESLRALGYAE
jgi:arylsulfatase A-like enzyme